MISKSGTGVRTGSYFEKEPNKKEPDHDPFEFDRITSGFICRVAVRGRSPALDSHRQGSAALFVAAITAKVAADIAIAVVGELVNVGLLAGRVARVIIGNVVRFGVLIRIAVNNA